MRPKVLNPQPHSGQHTELVIGIDVGTTFSGVCYAFLRPGEVPQIYSVTKFTDQTSGDKKIPSIMYYDKDMNLRAAGATAVSENVIQEAEFEGWLKVQYFKMRLRPSNMEIDTHGLEIESLPTTKSATDIMGDFLFYLCIETIEYIRNNHSDSVELLSSVFSHTRFVLSHPNGWTGLPQQRMREAAVHGGLVDDMEDAHAKIRFVSEGEASALSCLASGFCPANLGRGYRFMIADMGGGTLDMTSYEVTNSSPLRLKELTSSDCRFAGAVFVNMNARKLVNKLLKGSKYDNPVILDDVIDDRFENSTKREFKDASKVSWLRVGESTDNDTKLGIRRGRLRIDGEDIAKCFERPLSEALKSIRGQIARCGGTPMPVWLVGGFSASDWMLSKLEEALDHDSIDVRRPSIDLAKAVAHGNVLFGLESSVQSRVTRSAYGIACSIPYEKSDWEHQRRKHLLYTNLQGICCVRGKFDVIVNKDVLVEEEKRFSRSYRRYIEDVWDSRFEVKVLSFEQDGSVPDWHNGNEDRFKPSCIIKTNLSHLCCDDSNIRTHNGKTFWDLTYDIEITFGSTELQARVKWTDNGETKYGPATIFYEE